MRTPVLPLFTPTEAAVLTRLSLKAVNNAIDRKIIPATASRRDGRATRLLDLRALMALTLERRLADQFVPAARRAVFDALATAPRNNVSLDGGFLMIDLREQRRDLASALRQLRRARQLVTSDPAVMGGDPVFRGTRVPVHAIAAQREQGDSDADILAGYPRLTAEMVRLAPIYAAAYPPRGRPKSQPWRDQAPVHAAHRKLATVAAG